MRNEWKAARNGLLTLGSSTMGARGAPALPPPEDFTRARVEECLFFFGRVISSSSDSGSSIRRISFSSASEDRNFSLSCVSWALNFSTSSIAVGLKTSATASGSARSQKAVLNSAVAEKSSESEIDRAIPRRRAGLSDSSLSEFNLIDGRRVIAVFSTRLD